MVASIQECIDLTYIKPSKELIERHRNVSYFPSFKIIISILKMAMDKDTIKLILIHFLGA